MANIKTYNELRSANLHENRRMLEELGVRMPRVGEKVMLNKPKLPPRQPKQRISPNIPEPDPEKNDEENKCNELGRSGARSFRVRLRPKNYQEEEDECIFEPPKPQIRAQRPLPSYGKIPDVEVGREWQTRMECSEDLIHRPTVAGIHGGPDGAFSVALSGGYEDDVDFGESFTYTGEGGRDLKGTKDKPKNLRTAPQSKDQSLDRGNLALARSVETQNPVRVVRGYKLDSQYAPEEGYRYDGLYLVKKYWAAVGKSGFKVWKFAFVRCDCEPAPWIQMPFGNLGSPTSPTTPASIPQTGAEASEAPTLEADDCDDYLQLEEAQIGAKQPDDRKRVKKKVSFNSKDDVKYFETESPEEEKPEPPGRVTTRSSSAKVVKNDGVNIPAEDEKPVQLRKRSQRTVKPTAKVLENYSAESEKGPPKLAVSTSPVVLITEISLKTIPNLGEALKGKDSKGDEIPQKERNENESPKKSPKLEKCSPMKSELQAKGKSTPEKSRSLGERANKWPHSPKKSIESEKCAKDALSPSGREKPKLAKPPKDEAPRKRSVSPEYPATHEQTISFKSSSDEVPRKRSISPDYPVTYEKPRLSKPLSDEVPRERSISPEYLPVDELRKKKSSERASHLSVTSPLTPENETTVKKFKGRLRKQPVSPPSTPVDEKRGKETRGRLRKLSTSPGHTSLDEKSKKSSKSSLENDDLKWCPTDENRKKSPKSSREDKLTERPVSPEYPPENERSEDISAQEVKKKRSMSPEEQQKKSLSECPKKSTNSLNSPSKDTSKKQALSPVTKNSDKQSKLSKSPSGEKPQKISKPPTVNGSKKSAKAAEIGPKQNRIEESLNSPSGSKASACSPKTGQTRILSPKKNNSISKQSPENSKRAQTPKSSETLKNKSASSRKSLKSTSPETLASSGSPDKADKEKLQSSEEKTKQTDSKVSCKRSRSSSDEDSVDAKVPMKKKLRVSSSSTKIPASKRETAEKVKEEKISQSDLSSENDDGAPKSPKFMEVEREEQPNLTEPVTKSRGKVVSDALTSPETKSSNSSSSSPTPNRTPTPIPTISVSSPASSESVSRAAVSVKPHDFLDNDEFPSDEEILNMMQFSLGTCTSDGTRIVVKMVNGKWIEMEENDNATNTNAPR